MFVHGHHSLEELQRLTKALTKKRIWLRHQAVVLAKQGHSAPRDRPGLGMLSPAPFRLGSAATTRGAWRPSRSGPTPDARPAWPAADVPRFRDRLEAGPTPEDGVCTFRCQDLRRILEEEFGVELAPAGDL